MRIENITGQFLAAKTSYTTEEKPVSNENGKDVLKPLEKDTVTFAKKEKRQKPAKDNERTVPFLHAVFLNLGQKRVKKLEAQAIEVREDAQDAMGFSYIGNITPCSRETITDGIGTNNGTRTTTQVYNYIGGELITAELNIEEDLKTGTKNTGQIFEFKSGKLAAVYENVVELKDGTKNFSRKYEADEEGHLHCVYNKVF